MDTPASFKNNNSQEQQFIHSFIDAKIQTFMPSPYSENSMSGGGIHQFLWTKIPWVGLRFLSSEMWFMNNSYEALLAPQCSHWQIACLLPPPSSHAIPVACPVHVCRQVSLIWRPPQLWDSIGQIDAWDRLKWLVWWSSSSDGSGGGNSMDHDLIRGQRSLWWLIWEACLTQRICNVQLEPWNALYFQLIALEF